jgi:hypothetical protein
MQKPHLNSEEIIEKFCNSQLTSGFVTTWRMIVVCHYAADVARFIACVGVDDDSNPQNEAPKVYMDGEEIPTDKGNIVFFLIFFKKVLKTIK